MVRMNAVVTGMALVLVTAAGASAQRVGRSTRPSRPVMATVTPPPVAVEARTTVSRRATEGRAECDRYRGGCRRDDYDRDYGRDRQHAHDRYCRHDYAVGRDFIQLGVDVGIPLPFDRRFDRSRGFDRRDFDRSPAWDHYRERSSGQISRPTPQPVRVRR